MMGDMHAAAHKHSESIQQHVHAVTTWPNPGTQTTHLNPIKHNHTPLQSKTQTSHKQRR